MKGLHAIQQSWMYVQILMSTSVVCVHSGQWERCVLKCACVWLHIFVCVTCVLRCCWLSDMCTHTPTDSWLTHSVLDHTCARLWPDHRPKWSDGDQEWRQRRKNLHQKYSYSNRIWSHSFPWYRGDWIVFPCQCSLTVLHFLWPDFF